MSDIQIVHLGTVVQARLGRVVDGDVQPLEPIQVTVAKFSPDAFAKAHELVADERDQGIERLAAQDEIPPPPFPCSGRRAGLGVVGSVQRHLEVSPHADDPLGLLLKVRRVRGKRHPAQQLVKELQRLPRKRGLAHDSATARQPSL